MNIRIETPKMELWRIENEFSNVPHSHEGQVQLTVPIHGTCHFTHERREYRLGEGCAVVQHPREEHHFRLGDNAGVIIIQLQAGSLAEEVRQEELSFRQYVNPREIQSRFRDWIGLLLSRDPSDQLSLQETEAMVVGYLHGALKGSFQPDGGGPMRRPAIADVHLSRVIDYIHANFRSPLTIDEMAAMALQSRYHFIRSFKSATGMSPYQYVLHTRIEEAKRKLRTTRMSVTDISLELGFSSTSQLHRAFMNAVGTSPEQYRK
ncbi:AraC family transcriptional regulator [Paenibacillus hemerocallicola]|uniref:AraC family transcriptional regulator n=1 Tax=Paenibacillus hemerocallicola TaxID=1172614 RepID=A0A5C4T7H8_9BACL|nr:AraC family transcriptional regulator [Paenibacillus hemerocallicola]TNJ64998.1 AraC family transcriptional regulator [Paenibacillus hemerocallicola]